MNSDHLKHISTVHRQQYVERRGWEWRIFLTEVTLLILTVPLMIKEKESLNGAGGWFIAFFWLSVLCSVSYLSFIHAASNKDKNYAQEAEDRLSLSEEGLARYRKKHKSTYQKANKYPANPIRVREQFIGSLNGTWSFKLQAGIIVCVASFVSIVAYRLT